MPLPSPQPYSITRNSETTIVYDTWEWWNISDTCGDLRDQCPIAAARRKEQPLRSRLCPHLEHRKDLAWLTLAPKHSHAPFLHRADPSRSWARHCIRNRQCSSPHHRMDYCRNYSLPTSCAQARDTTITQRRWIRKMGKLLSIALEFIPHQILWDIGVRSILIVPVI